MNQKLIDMARQAGWEYAHGDSGYEPLWKFAALVAAAERERILAVIGDNQCECRCAEVVRERGETK